MVLVNLNFKIKMIKQKILIFWLLFFSLPCMSEIILYEDLIYKPRDKYEIVKHYVKFHKNSNEPFTGEAIIPSVYNKTITKNFFDNGVPKGWVLFSSEGKIEIISYGSGYRNERDINRGMQIYPRSPWVSQCDINCISLLNSDEFLILETERKDIEKQINILNGQISQAEVQFDLSHNFFLKGLKNYLYQKKEKLISEKDDLSEFLKHNKDINSLIAADEFLRKRRKIIDNKIEKYVNNLNKQITSQNKEFNLNNFYELLDIINQKI